MTTATKSATRKPRSSAAKAVHPSNDAEQLTPTGRTSYVDKHGLKRWGIKPIK